MPNDFENPNEQGLEAITDDELDVISGGTQFVFRGNGFQRNSWFVTSLTKLMIQGHIRDEMSLPLGSGTKEITIEGRRYRVWQVDNTVYVEEAI